MIPVILAGGKGSRLGELTKNTSKPMLKVQKRPFLEHLLLYLRDRGYSHALVCVGHKRESIMDYFDLDWCILNNFRTDFSEESKPLGTAGALKNAKHAIKETFILFNGDTYFSFDLKKLIADHLENDFVATIATVNGVDSGVWICEPEIIDLIDDNIKSMNHDLYPLLESNGLVKKVEMEGTFLDFGNSVDDYRKIQKVKLWS